MEEQSGKTKASETKRTQYTYAMVSLVIFVAAILGVTLVTTNNRNANKPAGVAQVRITKTGFVPATLSVTEGTRVVWVNTDNGLHQVASNPYPKDNDLASLKSAILNNGQTYQYTADKTGTYSYHDDLKPTTNGTLVVQKR